MTAPAPAIPGARTLHFSGRRRPAMVEGCLDVLEDAAVAADNLGLDTAAARAIRTEAAERLGAGADVYVLALVGGTGVGKSSLLNALAGRTVTAAGPRRPTTATPVAWVAASAAEAVAPVLARLGTVDRRLHDEPSLAGVVVLDLPDTDSLEAANRARVDELLPRVDAVAWVTDPEKYADALLHDELLRRWVPRLDRQVVVLNKADRLAPDRLDQVRGHLARVLGADLAGTGSGRPEVLTATATGGPTGVAGLRRWLESAVDAKAVVAGRLAAASADTIASLARAAGVSGEAGRRPLVDAEARGRAVAAATGQALRVVDLPGVRRQAVAATRAAARRRGTGPIGRVTSLAYRASGRASRVADPAAHLAAWRARGSLARGVAPVTEAMVRAIAAAPPALRPALADAADPVALERRLGQAVDRAIAAQPPFEAPSSRAWPVLGLASTLATAVLVAAVAWTILWVLVRPPVDGVTVPVLGTVPAPLALLAGALVAGLVPARLLALHAGLLGRRWADRLEATLRTEVASSVADEAFVVVDRVEASRRALWLAARAAETACG